LDETILDFLKLVVRKPSMTRLVFLIALFGIVAVKCTPKIAYAGFNHILAFESKSATVSAFDYRRSTQKSTCNTFAHPPLLTNAPLHDWLMVASVKAGTADDISYTYLGFEHVLVEVNNFLFLRPNAQTFSETNIKYTDTSEAG
jgi:hypothetical protein